MSVECTLSITDTV